jgi:uncharacterized protein with HEPN domain
MRNPIVSDNLKIIVESIDLIEDRFLKINLADEFVTSPEGVLLLDAISMRLQVIGETVKKIDKIEPSLFEMYQDVEWRKIMRLRDIISHHYEMVDHEIIFDICEAHLPRLKLAIQNIIRKENQSNSGNSA